MISQSVLPELRHEAESTRKMLERVPYDKWDWKPHDKSFTLGRLADHVADLVYWIPFTLGSSELDFANNPHKEKKAGSSEELVRNVEENTRAAIAAVEAATDEQWMQPWTMRSGEQVFFTMPKIAVVRTWALNHLIHHRAQLSVYLRLLDVPVPGMYGPTADEM
ncbi:MAG: damage-inducible protein DinB [Sphingobacteriales bacterium]|nr:MAG: damage-inducible protein DinB [Sphingobacteriales bacterium]